MPKKKVAHIVHPAQMLTAAKDGDHVTSLCGDGVIKGEPHRTDAPICRKCFMAQLDADDAATATALIAHLEQIAAARRVAFAEGRQTHANEIILLANRQTDEARHPRYEDLGRALKLKLVDDGEATVTKERVASVELVHSGNSYAVIVDGKAVHVGTDEVVARHHYNDVHQVIYGSQTESSMV